MLIEDTIRSSPVSDDGGGGGGAEWIKNRDPVIARLKRHQRRRLPVKYSPVKCHPRTYRRRPPITYWRPATCGQLLTIPWSPVVPKCPSPISMWSNRPPERQCPSTWARTAFGISLPPPVGHRRPTWRTCCRPELISSEWTMSSPPRWLANTGRMRSSFWRLVPKNQTLPICYRWLLKRRKLSTLTL